MKTYLLFLCLSVALLLTACFDDDSTVAIEANRVQKINIDGLKDTSMLALSVLEVTPEVKGFTDEELTFAWYIYGGQFGEKGEYRKNKIGENKKLSWPVAVKNGNYIVICEATHKQTNYFGMQNFSLNVTSAFSDGFYLLKETADGNSELDFYNYREKFVNNDMLTTMHGAPLAGKPRNMNAVYAKIYMDAETATSTYATGVFVASGEKEFGVYNTLDMSLMFDRNTLLFSRMEENEIPYAMGTTANYNYYFSNKGVRSEMFAGGPPMFASEFATGQLGVPVSAGASSFIQAYDGQGLSYWSESEHRLMNTNGLEIGYKRGYDGPVPEWDKLTVVTTGWSTGTDNLIWYLFQHENKERYLVIINRKLISEIRRLDASLNIAKASIVAGRGKNESYIYSVSDNQLYRYGISEETETVMPMPSLPEGKITYVTNLFYRTNFDYFVIGVQNGERYEVAMYELQGGQPDGKPLHTFGGTGLVKKVCYAVPMQYYDMPNQLIFNYGWGAADFPY